MGVDLAEVLLRLFRSGRTQTFVVLYSKLLQVTLLLCPIFILWYREKGLNCLGTFRNFDDRRHELLYKAIDFEKTWPEVMDKVDQQTFDMGAVMILISHNHD